MKDQSTDDICLLHSDKIHGMEASPPENRIFYADEFHLLRGLEKGEVDLVFIFPEAFEQSELEDFEEVGPSVMCSADPTLSIVTLKGSPLRQWFNKAFGELKESGEYYKICHDGERKHGI
ncbi:uncharacterized protein LOC144452683 [Glandiceps talaboti]